MRVTIQIPDELYELYARRAEASDTRPSSYLSDVLKRFQSVDLADRTLIVHKATRQKLEDLFAQPLADESTLLRLVEKILRLQVEGVELSFTPGQKAEILRVAKRNNVAYEEQIRRTVKSLEGLFFNSMAGGF